MDQTVPKAFIVHGRDIAARDELAKFLAAVGVDDLSFSTVAASLGPMPFVADIVREALRKADIVLVLFTPDESAILYDAPSGRWLGNHDTGSRWQARPNVLFEAGVCFGQHREKTVLLTLGADFQLFSDVGGVHIVRMHESGARDKLLARIQSVIPAAAPIREDWRSPAVSGDFESCIRRRWAPYDEIQDLAEKCRTRILESKQSKESLLGLVRKVAIGDQRDWRLLSPIDFMMAIEPSVPSRIKNDVYWWLIVYGFFRFIDIDQFFEGDGQAWTDSVNYAQFSDRGHALIERLRCGLQ